MKLGATILALFLVTEVLADEVWEPVGPETCLTYGVDQSWVAPDVFYCTAEGDSLPRLMKSEDHGLTWQYVSEVEYESTNYGIHASPADVLFAPGSGSCRRSLDGGETWEEIEFDGSFCQMSFTASAEEEVLAGGFVDDSLPHIAFFRSLDSGESWTANILSAEYSFGYCIAAHPTQTGHILVGGRLVSENEGLLFRSVDGGETFENVSSPLWGNYGSRVNAVCFPGDDPATFLAGNNDGVYLTDDGGASWTQVGSQQSVGGFTVVCTEEGLLYCSHEMGVSRSTDGGQSWEPCSDGLYGSGHSEGLISSSSQDGHLFVPSSVGLFQSPDGGESWDHTAFGNAWGWVLDLECGGSGSSAVYAAVANENPSFQPSELYRSLDAGETWTSLLPIESQVRAVAADPFDAQTAMYIGKLAGGDSTRVYRTIDGGDSWASVDDYCLNYAVIDACPGNPGRYWTVGVHYSPVLASFETVVSRTDDYGAGWARYTIDPTGSFWPDAFAVDPSHPDTAYQTNGDVFGYTFDGGESWSVHSITGFQNEPEALIASPEQEGMLYLTSSLDSGQLGKSVDAGFSWTGIGEELESCRDLDIDQLWPQTLYAACSQYGVASSCDGGINWSYLGEGLEGESVLEVALIPQEYVVCGTVDGCCFRHTAPAALEDGGFGQVPSAIPLRVSPNPATVANCVMSVTQRSPGALLVEVYDIAGRRIARSLEGPFEAGTSTVGLAEVLEGKVPPVGIYVLRCRPENGTPTSARVVLLR